MSQTDITNQLYALLREQTALYEQTTALYGQTARALEEFARTNMRLERLEAVINPAPSPPAPPVTIALSSEEIILEEIIPEDGREKVSEEIAPEHVSSPPVSASEQVFLAQRASAVQVLLSGGNLLVLEERFPLAISFILSIKAVMALVDKMRRSVGAFPFDPGLLLVCFPMC